MEDSYNINVYVGVNHFLNEHNSIDDIEDGESLEEGEVDVSTDSGHGLSYLDKMVRNVSSLGFGRADVLRTLIELNPDVRTLADLAFLHRVLDKLVTDTGISSARGERVLVAPRLSEFKLVSQNFIWPVMEMAEYEFGLGSLNKVNFDNVLVVTNIPPLDDSYISLLYELFMSLMFSQIGM